MTHDEALLDSIAVLALGALPESEAKELRSHIAGCSACMKEYRELRSTADAIALSADENSEQSEIERARLKSRVMRAVREDAGAARRRAVASPPWIAWGAAAAALLIAAGTALSDGSLRSENAANKARLAQFSANVGAELQTAAEARERLAYLESKLGDVFSPGSRHYAVRGGEVVRSGDALFIAMGHLPALPAGKVYQAWTIAPGAKIPAPSVTFTAEGGGIALVKLPVSAARVGAVAVTIEPTGGSKAPTSAPAFIRKLG